MDLNTSVEAGTELPVEAVQFIELFAKANSGDDTAAGEVLSLMDTLTAGAGDEAGLSAATEKMVNVAEIARGALLAAVYGHKNVLLKELGRRRLERIEREVAGPDPSPLERLLAERVAVCWLQVHHYEAQYAGRMNRTPLDPLCVQMDEFYQKRLDRAVRRYESAIKSLAQVRKLQIPTLQLNIADQQVNIGQQQVNVEGHVGGQAEPPAPGDADGGCSDGG